MSRKISRRQFVRTSAAAAALAANPFWSPRPATARTAAADRPLIGAIGLGSQGTPDARRAARFGEVVALCDVHRPHAERARQRLFEQAEIYEDYRRLLDRNEIEAVTIATPDHWHAEIALAAMEAGKHVYLEKPLSLTVAEGQQLVAMAKKTGRVLQVGTQQRGDQIQTFGRAVATVRSGALGKIKRIHVHLPLTSEQGGPFSAESVPEGLNWDFWLGQAPQAAYSPERSHVRFRWWYDYSGGIVTDWGAHHLDIVHWALDCENSGPSTVDGSKTQLPNIPGGFTTPKFVHVDLLYPGNIPVRLWAQPPGGEGVTFEGERSTLGVARGRIFGPAIDEQDAKPAIKDQILADVEKLFHGNTAQLGDHMGNFFEAWQHGKRPISDVASQHRTATACHLANISIRLKRKLTWDPVKEQFVGDEQANSMLRRSGRAPYQVRGDA